MFSKAKKILALGLTLMGIGSFAGCSDASMGSDSLLRPPRATGDKAAIQDIIAAEAGGSYTLKYPQKGENRSAIMLRNTDTDNEYAIALYSTENDTKLNVSIITYSAETDSWKCIGTYANTGSGVDRVLFSDISGDKNEEIIIGWTSYNSAQKSLTAYSLKSDESFEMGIDETYDELVTADLTGNMADDILLLSLSTQEKPSTATLLQYSEKDKRPVGKYSLQLDSEVIAFSNIISGDVAVNTTGKRTTATGTKAENSKAEPNKPDNNSKTEVSKTAENHKTETSKAESSQPSQTSKASQEQKAPENLPDGDMMKKGVVVDGRRSDNTFCTQMIYYDIVNDELTDPINATTSSTYPYPGNNPTQRSEAVFSRDINGDGLIEVPVVKQMNASVDENGTAVCNQVGWDQYDAKEKKLNPVLSTVMNLKDGYYVVIPQRWDGSVTARSNPDTREMSFYLWNSKTSSIGDKLLTISRFTEQQWKETEENQYIPLDIRSENSKAIFAAQIFHTDADDSLNITAEELQTLIFAI